MDHVTRALAHFLAKHDLPADGVKIIIEFPNTRLAKTAEACIKLDLRPYQRDMVGQSFGAIETMNGIALSLRSRER